MRTPFDAEVRQDHGQRHQQCRRLHDRKVQVQDGAHQQIPDAGPGKHRLDDDRAAEQPTDLQPHQRDDRNQDVAQAVMDDHPPLRRTLRPGRSHVIRRHRLDHMRPRQPAMLAMRSIASVTDGSTTDFASP